MIGDELCIVWEDESESYFPAEFLRRHSPSAQNIGEKDIEWNKTASLTVLIHHFLLIFIDNYLKKFFTR